MIIKKNESGFLLCPKCGKKTNVKVLPKTVMTDYVLFCKHCKSETIIDYKA